MGYFYFTLPAPPTIAEALTPAPKPNPVWGVFDKKILEFCKKKLRSPGSYVFRYSLREIPLPLGISNLFAARFIAYFGRFVPYMPPHFFARRFSRKVLYVLSSLTFVFASIHYFVPIRSLFNSYLVLSLLLSHMLSWSCWCSSYVPSRSLPYPNFNCNNDRTN